MQNLDQTMALKRSLDEMVCRYYVDVTDGTSTYNGMYSKKK